MFIFGLPLWQSNAVQLSRQIINATQKHFGKAVIRYELGNEVGLGYLFCHHLCQALTLTASRIVSLIVGSEECVLQQQPFRRPRLRQQKQM
jgi:hypothetical protein